MAGPINNNNFGKKLGNMAKKAKQRADNGKNFDVMDPGASNPNVEKAKKNAGKAASKAIKNVGKAIGKLIKSLIKALLSLGWVGILILVILILILIIIAIVTAINIMPGMMKSKLAQLFKIDVGNWFMNGAVSKLEDDYSDIIDVANYIEGMNYSLIGDGFVTPNLDRDSDIYTISEVLAKNPTYVYKTGTDGKTHFYYEDFSIDNLTEAQARSLDESKRVQMKYYDNLGRTIINSTGMPENSGDEYTDEYGIIRSTEARDAGDGTDRGKVVRVAENGKKNYRLLRTYLLSNYRIYTLKNSDETILKEIANLYREHFGGNHDAWAKGLVKLYVANGGVASNHWWWGEGGLRSLGSTAQMTDTSLILRKGFFNREIEFSIAGWSPRYGMSLDFLIALHLGTGAPDLVYAMLQNFDTEVQVYLDDVGESSIESRYVDPKAIVPVPEGVSISTIKTALADYNFGINGFIINDAELTQWINGLFLSRGACAEIFKKVDTLKSQDTCTYTVTDYVILDITGGSGRITYPDLWDYFRGDVHYGEHEGKDILQKLYGYDDTDLESIDYNTMIDAGTDYHYEYNRETSLMSYKLKNGMGYEDEIDYDAAYNDAIADRNRIRGSLEDKWNMVSSYITPQITYADPEPQSNGKVYEIVMNKESAEWDAFLDDDGNVVDQAADILNGKATNESGFGYSSYIYTVYETGVVNPDGTIQKYEDGGVQQGEEISKVEVARFTYAHHGEDPNEFDVNIIDSERPTYTVIVYYTQDSEGNENYELECMYNIPNGTTDSTDDYDPVNPLIIDWIREDESDTLITYKAAYWELIDVGEILQPDDNYWNGPSVSINIYGEYIGITFACGRTDLVNASSYDEYYEPGSHIYIEYPLEGIRDAYENGHATLQTEKILRDVLYINVAIREKTTEELQADGVLDENGMPTGEHGRCSDEARGPNGEKFKRTCKACQRYIRAVAGALAEISDPDFQAYTPYIARVVGSWFRDTYFIIPKERDAAIAEYSGIARDPMHYDIYNEEGEYVRTVYEPTEQGTNHPEFNALNAYDSGSAVFVKVDEEYLGDSGEYWTSYEKKGNGEYQLYVLNADGTTGIQKLESFLEQGYIKEIFIEKRYGPEDENYRKNGYLKEEYLGAPPETYLVKGSNNNVLVQPNTFESQEKAEEAGWAFVKRAEILDIRNNFAENHTIWKESSTADRINSAEILWSAYAFDSNGLVKPWARVPRSAENEKVNALYDIIYREEEDYTSGIFYQVSTTNNVTQVEDAQRGETNALVKYLFKYRKFYLYDSSEDRALAIAHDKQRILHGYDYYVAKDYDTEDRYYNNKIVTDKNAVKDVPYSWENISGGENFYHYLGLLDEPENGNKGVLSRLYENGDGKTWQEKVIGLLNLYGRSAIRQSYGWTNEKYIDDEDLATQWFDWQLDMFYMNKYGVDLKKYYQVGFDLLKINYDPRDPDLVGNVQITKSSLNVFSILENTGSIDAEYAYRDFKELVVELNYFDKEDLSTKIQGVFTWMLPESDIFGWPVRPWDKQDVDYGTLIQSKATYEALGLVSSEEESISDEEPDDEETDDEEDTDDEDTDEVDSVTTVQFEGYEEGEPVVSPVTGKILEIGTHERLNVYSGEMEEVEFITIQVVDSIKYFQELRLGTVSEHETERYGYRSSTQYTLAEALDLFYREYSDVCIDEDYKGYTITIDGFDVDLLYTGEDESASGSLGSDVQEKLNNGVYKQNEVHALYNSEEMAKLEEIEQAKEDAPFFINCRETSPYPVDGYIGDPNSIVGYYIKEGKYLGKTIEPNAKKARIEGLPEFPEGIIPPEGIVPGVSLPAIPQVQLPQISTSTDGLDDKLTYTYDDFKNVPGDYIRIIIKDSDYAIVDDVERFFKTT